DIHILSDSRTNAILVSAPAETMRLIEKLILELDIASAATAEVKVFTLKKSDATTTATLLSNLYSRGTTTGGTVGLGTANANQPRALLGLGGEISEGANLVDVRLAVDVRTNSIIVAGSPSDIDTMRAIIYKLEDSESAQLLSKVYKLRNAAAADVQTAVLNF